MKVVTELFRVEGRAGFERERITSGREPPQA